MTETASYYDRSGITHLDGTRIFQNEGDRRNEREIASIVERAWGCTLHSFGALSPIDWYAQRQSRLVGLLELKSRTHEHETYPSVFLNVRKWLSLTIGATGLGVPAIFVVRFIDGVYWVPLADVDARANRIAGCLRIVKSENDIEPVIDVPVSLLRVCGGDHGAA